MFFELQLSAGVFTRIVRNRLNALPLCVDRELVDDTGQISGVKGTRLVVDRVEFGSSTWIQREKAIDVVDGLPKPRDVATQSVWILWPTNHTSFTVPFLQVKQELMIHLVRAADLEANGVKPTPPVKTITIYPVFNVSLTAAKQTQGGGPLTLSYSLAHVDFGFYFLALSAAERADIENSASMIQLPPTTLDLGPLTAMLKRPVGAINAGITCDEGGTFIALRVDFDIHASPVAVEPAFFQVSPQNLLDGRDWAMLVDANLLVQDAQTRAKNALAATPKVRLSSGPHVAWDPAGVAIDVQADVELVDACPFFGDDIDMDVDLAIRLGLSVPTANTFRTHFHLHGEPSDVGEEIACAITGALLWPFVGPLFLKDESIGVGLGAYLAGLAVGPAVTFVGIIAAIETKKLSSDISKDLGSSCQKIDDENYECNEVVGLVMQLSPQSNSTLELERANGVARGLVLSGSVSNLRDLFLGSLDAVRVCPFAWQVLGRCTGNGRSNFHVGNQATISVHGTPPAGLCKAYVLDDPAHEFALTVNENDVTIVPRFTPAYQAAPYPCRVRVVTNRGVRTITLHAPAGLSDAEGKKLDAERLAAHVSCYYWEKVFTPIEKLRWRPDPPFDAHRYMQFWQIVVRGLEPHESIRVLRHDGVMVMSAMPSRAGVAHLVMTFGGADAPTDLSLELLGKHEDDETAREIATQQVSFEHRAELPVVGPLRAMYFEGGARRRRLVIDDAVGETTWDVASAAPAVLRSTSRSDARPSCDDVVVHTGKRVGKPMTSTFRAALERLTDRFGRPEAVGSPRVGGVAESLYVRTKRGAVLYDISRGVDEAREIHVYEGPAWHEDVALGGEFLARFDVRLGVVDLYVAVRGHACE